jgi:hypothetical protein
MNISSVKEFSDFLIISARQEAFYFPIDRFFLEEYVNKIKEFDRREFLLYNFEIASLTYTVQLMICLPDIWAEVTIEDINWLLSQFESIFSFYALIVFIYKYIEVDIVDFIFKSVLVPNLVKAELKVFLTDQYMNLYKTEYEEEIFDKNLIGIRREDWVYVKQLFLLDGGINPVSKSPSELKGYIDSLLFNG